MLRAKGSRGSITVEAAIVLPVFICVVISLSMLIKLIYIHDIIQHSIDEAANELAAYSYMYHVSDLQQIDETMQDNLESNSGQAQGHFDTVVGAYETMEKAYSSGSDYIENLDTALQTDKGFVDRAEEIIFESRDLYQEGQELAKNGIDNINKLQQAFEEASKDPKKEAESIAWMLSKGIYSDAKTIIAVPIVKHTVGKYLIGTDGVDIDKTLRKLNISNGFAGLDFYSSTFFDGDENIDIIVKYRVDLPLPIKLLPDIYMVQRGCARAWLNGGDGTSLHKISIWELPNKQRGLKIEELYGGNLPYDFPAIDIYDDTSKTGTSIKSTNLNSKTYQDKAKLNKLLKGYIDDIKARDTIVYNDKRYDIVHKKLIIVIPKGSINEINGDVLEQAKSYAATNGIDITISELE
jgi:hypothetical protein